MSDPYVTSRIRRGLAVLMDEAPVPPDFEDLTTTSLQPLTSKKPRPIAAVLSATAVMAVVAIGGLWLFQPGGPTEPAAESSTDTKSVDSTITTVPTATTSPEQDDIAAPIDVEAVAAEFLEDIPLPSGLDPSQITDSITAADLDLIMEGEELPPRIARIEIDRYQIGARVAGAAICAWIEVWLDSTASGDQERADEAVSALGASRSWSVLAEMDPIGDFPEVVRIYADAVAGDGTVPAGGPATVADAYQSAFSCLGSGAGTSP